MSSADLTYYIYVTGYGSEEGNFQLSVDKIPVPDNNECVDAQSLSVATFPATANALGTLLGATNNGGEACDGSADGGDVFYSFTIDQENHVGVTVNPFTGADLVVSVMDECDGSVIACINNEGDRK